MKNNLKIYLLVSALVLSSFSIKSFASDNKFTIKNITKYQNEDVVEEKELSGSSNESHTEIIMSYEEPTPTPSLKPTPIPITLDTLPITEIYEFPEETAIFQFLDNNYSCDCNRSLFIREEYGKNAIPELDCGDEIMLVKYHIEYWD